EAGGIVGAHLEEHAQLEFAQRFPAQKSIDVVVAVAGDNHMIANTRPFANERVQQRGWVAAGIFVGGEVEILLVAELVIFLETVNEQEGGRTLRALGVVTSSFSFL